MTDSTHAPVSPVSPFARLVLGLALVSPLTACDAEPEGEGTDQTDRSNVRTAILAEDADLDADFSEDEFFAEDEESAKGENSAGASDLLAMPPAAQAAMDAAEEARLAPQFFACPYYLTYDPTAFDEFGNSVNGWFGVALDLFVIDKPSWHVFGNSLALVCGTTQSPHLFMSVRRNVQGVTSCVTSGIGPHAWFVCT
jgi:hypothetical protein